MPTLPNIEDLGQRPIPQSNRQIATVRNAGAVGEAVAGVGREGAQAAVALSEIDQRRQASQAGVDFATMTGEIQQQVDEQRANAGPGGGGHLETVRAYTEQRTQHFIAGIRDRHVREQFETNVAQLRARTYASEDQWEISQRRDLAQSNYEESGRLLYNHLQTHPDASTLQNYIDASASSLTGADGVSADLADKLIRERRANLAQAYVRGLTEQNPAAAKEVMGSGALNQWLGTDDAHSLTGSADAAVRTQEADARRVAATAATAARAQIDVFQHRLTSHDPTITDEEIARYGQIARAAGLSVDEYDLAKAQVMHRADQEFRNAGPAEISNEIHQLDTRIAQGGTHASPDDVVRRDHLHTLLTQRTQQVQNDPLGAYAATGGVVAPLNPNDPASVRARVAASQAARARFGFGSVLTPQETALMHEQATNGGPAGRLQAVQTLGAIASYDQQAALDAAREVAPGDASFRHALRLGGYVRQQVIAGADARHLLPGRMTDPDGNPSSFDALSQQWFVAHGAPSLAASQPEFINDVLEGARNIYAERARRQGRSAAAEFNPTEMSISVSLALGQTPRGGGLASWTLGPRAADGNPQGFLLPTGMPQREFEERMANLPMARTGGHWPRGAVNGTPVLASGQPISTDDIRSQFVPVAIRDGVYQFHRGNQALTSSNGGPFELDIRLIPPLAHRRIAVITHGPPQVHNRPALPEMHSSGSPDPTLSPAQYRALHPGR